MKTFLKLTDVANEAVLVSVDDILLIERINVNTATRITIKEEEVVVVKETPKEIFDILCKVRRDGNL